jgi:transcription initiation factor TFIIIB Brf1 subunit/transcription initiation factor TFIIB
MELIRGSAFPLDIKKRAGEIYKASGKRPRGYDRQKNAAYCVYMAFLERMEHISVNVIAEAFAVKIQDFRQTIIKAGKMAPTYSPPNVFASAVDVLSTFLLHLRLPEELSASLIPLINTVYKYPAAELMSPWDICYAVLTKFVEVTGLQYNINCQTNIVLKKADVEYVKQVISFEYRL